MIDSALARLADVQVWIDHGPVFRLLYLFCQEVCIAWPQVEQITLLFLPTVAAFAVVRIPILIDAWPCRVQRLVVILIVSLTCWCALTAFRDLSSKRRDLLLTPRRIRWHSHLYRSRVISVNRWARTTSVRKLCFKWALCILISRHITHWTDLV